MEEIKTMPRPFPPPFPAPPRPRPRQGQTRACVGGVLPWRRRCRGNPNQRLQAMASGASRSWGRVPPQLAATSVRAELESRACLSWGRHGLGAGRVEEQPRERLDSGGGDERPGSKPRERYGTGRGEAVRAKRRELCAWS